MAREVDTGGPIPKLDDCVLLFVHGRQKPYAAEAYQRYVEATGRLLGKYRAEVVTVGGGIDSQYTTSDWPINAVIRFPSLRAAEGYLSDPLYRKIEATYREAAYDDLQLNLVAPRPSDALARSARLG